MENLEKNLETVKNFVMETLLNLYYFFKKESILMNI